MSFCCADLVEMFSLTDTPITVIAGHAYLHREIQWVYLAEAVDNFLDTIPWTKGGELAIVTGSSIKGDADTALINYLRRSKKRTSPVLSSISANTSTKYLLASLQSLKAVRFR